jgi:4-amino-4-deoxy-L-arabinose transferase-like glycosyltransferase
MILLVAVVLRLGFVLSSPPRPLYWDEPLYEELAARYQDAWSSLVGTAGGVTLSEAFRTSLQKGEVYPAIVASVYSICGREPRAVFLLQALLDAATCLLLHGLARAVGGARAGLIAVTLAALYEPFIFSAARLQTETLASLLYVGGLWAVCVPQRRRTAASFCAGVLIAASMLAKPALQGLFPVLLPAVLVRNWDRPRGERLMLALACAAGFAVVVGPRLVLTTAVTGQPVWASTLDPSADMYGGAIVGNVGWKTDGLSFASPPRDELLAVLGDPPTRRWAAADMREATIRTWVRHPVESAAVTLHKIYEAWLHPYNDSRWTFLTGETGQAAWHRVVLVLALFGMPLSLYRWRAGIPLIVTTLYLWLTYLTVKIEVRYAIMAMPMMICFAAVAVAVLSTGWEIAWRAGRRGHLVVLAAVAAVALIAAVQLSIDRLLQLFPLTPDAAHGVRVAVLLFVIVWLAYGAAELATHLWRRSTTLALLAPSVAAAALVLLFGRPLAQAWREWQSTLTANRGIARQEFLLPPAIERPVSAELKLDLMPEGAGGYDVAVRVNGEEIKRYRGGVTRGDADLPLQEAYQQIFVARRRTREPDKAWYTIGIPPDLVSPGNRVAVEVALEGEGRPSGSLVLFGDYPAGAHTYAGPSLFAPALRADSSLYKYLAEGDFRMRRSIQLSGSSQSRFHDGSAWSDQDLGFDPGRQQGRYRIFLLLFYDRGIAIL